MKSRRRSQAADRPRRLAIEPLESRCLLAGLTETFGDPAPVDCHAAGLSVVEFQPRVTDLHGQPIDHVRVGEAFLLELLVRDVRESPEGVFAAFMDVEFDAALLEAVGDLDYAEMYSVARDGTVEQPGLLDEVGAASGSLRPIGGGDFLLASIMMKASAPGTVTLRTDPADENITHEVLVYGWDDPIPTQLVHYGELTLPVLETGAPRPDPVLDTDDPAAIAADVAVEGSGTVQADLDTYCAPPRDWRLDLRADSLPSIPHVEPESEWNAPGDSPVFISTLHGNSSEDVGNSPAGNAQVFLSRDSHGTFWSVVLAADSRVYSPRELTFAAPRNRGELLTDDARPISPPVEDRYFAVTEDFSSPREHLQRVADELIKAVSIPAASLASRLQPVDGAEYASSASLDVSLEAASDIAPDLHSRLDPAEATLDETGISRDR